MFRSSFAVIFALACSAFAGPKADPGSDWQTWDRWNPASAVATQASQPASQGWGQWSTSGCQCPPSPTPSIVTVTQQSTVTLPPQTITVTKQNIVTLPAQTVTVTSTSPQTKTITLQGSDTTIVSTSGITSTALSTVTSFSDITSTTTQYATTSFTTTVTTGAPLCGGGTIINSYITNIVGSTCTATVTATVSPPCPSVVCCGSNTNCTSGNTINDNATLVGLIAYFEGPFLAVLSKNITDSLSANISEDITNSLTKNITQSWNATLTNYFDNNFPYTFNESISSVITTDINATLDRYYGSHNITNGGANATCKVNLTDGDLYYLNQSITDVLFGYMVYEFTNQTSPLGSSIETHCSYKTTPWWAILLIVLLIIFGVLTLFGLIWLLCFRKTKVGKKHEHVGGGGGAICEQCGQPRESCTCGSS